jgi:hypothetical protein
MRLVVASAAAAEMRTRGRDAVRRRLDDCGGVRAGEAGLFLGDGGFDLFRCENERDEDGLTAAAVVGRETSESVAAVDQLFYVQEQELILRHGERKTSSASGVSRRESNCGSRIKLSRSLNRES